MTFAIAPFLLRISYRALLDLEAGEELVESASAPVLFSTKVPAPMSPSEWRAHRFAVALGIGGQRNSQIHVAGAGATRRCGSQEHFVSRAGRRTADAHRKLAGRADYYATTGQRVGTAVSARIRRSGGGREVDGVALDYTLAGPQLGLLLRYPHATVCLITRIVLSLRR